MVHACWDQACIDQLEPVLVDQRLQPEQLIAASTKGEYLFYAVERLLKGVEIKLPDGILCLDKDGNGWDGLRVQWWRQNAETLGDMALPLGVDIGPAADLPAPTEIPVYGAEQPPCFLGHYWWHGTPAPLTDNIACLDYSVAKGGPLMAYRWQGEQTLSAEHFVSTDSE